MPELGARGQYIFTDLDELDLIIEELEKLKVDISIDDEQLRRAIAIASPPAYDDMSEGQTGAYCESLELARLHSTSMLTYVSSQLDKLRATRNAYAETDAEAEERLHDAEGDGG